MKVLKVSFALVGTGSRCWHVDIDGSSYTIRNVASISGLQIGHFLNSSNDFFPQGTQITGFSGIGPYDIFLSLLQINQNGVVVLYLKWEQIH